MTAKRRPTTDARKLPSDKTSLPLPQASIVIAYYDLIDELLIEAIRSEAGSLLGKAPKKEAIRTDALVDDVVRALSDKLFDFAKLLSDRNVNELAATFGWPLSANRVITPAQIAGWQKQNVSLITKLTAQARARVNNSIVAGTGRGLSYRELEKNVQRDLQVSRARARLIARDQTLKLNSQVTRAAHEAAGVKRFRWKTSKDERVREDHRRLHDVVFSWDDPPRNWRGEPIVPGQDYQCRCTAYPVDDVFRDLPSLV